jgi:TPR repeat protein
MYESGRGVPMDIDEAVRWYWKAAEHGLREAVGNLKRLGIEDIK